MREIKFRGLRTDGKGWVYGCFLKREYPSFTDYSIWTPKGTIPVISESVGQYTGLKDKNGVDIYEGDVVKFSTRRYHFGREKGLQTITFKSDVIFDDGCFMISETQKYDTYLYTFSEEVEIIGNIHESEVSHG